MRTAVPDDQDVGAPSHKNQRVSVAVPRSKDQAVLVRKNQCVANAFTQVAESSSTGDVAPILKDLVLTTDAQEFNCIRAGSIVATTIAATKEQ